MAIQNTRSNTSGNVPSSLQDGQIGIQQADGVLFSRSVDGSIRRTLLPKRFGVADAAFTVRAWDTYVGIASLTASRTITLPAASAYPAGTPLTIADEAGACSPTVVATIAAAGSDKINGNVSYGMAQAYLGIILFSDGASKWTAIALPGSGASNAVLYVAQSLTAGQQDQARLNIGGAAAAGPSATTALLALDFDRDQIATGTSTLTMPSTVAPGWRSGIIFNDNATTGLVTLAVPPGHMLDGVTNGSLLLFPRQKARLRLISSGVWRSYWVDRIPIIAAMSPGAAVASWDIALPVGYKTFQIIGTGFQPGTAGAIPYFRLSDDGGSTLKSGAGDYASMVAYSTNGGTPAATPVAGAQGQLAGALAAGGGNTAHFEMRLDPGGGGMRPTYESRAGFVDNASGGLSWANYEGLVTSIGTNRANLIRILWSTGTGIGGYTVVGVP